MTASIARFAHKERVRRGQWLSTTKHLGWLKRCRKGSTHSSAAWVMVLAAHLREDASGAGPVLAVFSSILAVARPLEHHTHRQPVR